MCGILGRINFKSAVSDEERYAFNRSNRQLSHRGPDFSSVINVHPRVIFGHNRLSIIDISEGSHQPFKKKNSPHCLVYNGEIYNYQDVKMSLLNEHCLFESAGDTEVLFEGFNRKKIDFISQINGMFAFGFWDENEQKLWLVRDRLGIKPLYILKTEEYLLFSSELRPLLYYSSKNIEKGVLTEWLWFQSNPSDCTLFDDIHLLPAGSWLSCTLDGRIEQGIYYSLMDKFKEKQEFSKEVLTNKIVESVKDRLISDVPIGAFLSGGIDSSVVVASMRKVTSDTIQTFSVGFDQESLDESYYAGLVAKKFETIHTKLEYSSSEILKLIPSAVDQLDYPTGDAINTWLVSKATKEAGITVALSGLGGDELFGGYPSFKRANQPLYKHKQLSFVARILGKVVGYRNRELEKYNWITSRESKAFYHTLISRAVFPNSIIEQLLPGFTYTPPEVLCDETTYAELTYYTKPLLLRDTDQTSMAHALEVRVPLLDYRLVDYMASVNQLYRYDSTWSYPKKILVDCFEDVLPEEVYKRKKQGFVLPMDSWIRNELKTYTKESLFDSPLSVYLNGSTIQQLWVDYLNKKSYVKWSLIWSLAVLGRWLQNNKC